MGHQTKIAMPNAKQLWLNYVSNRILSRLILNIKVQETCHNSRISLKLNMQHTLMLRMLAYSIWNSRNIIDEVQFHLCWGKKTEGQSVWPLIPMQYLLSEVSQKILFDIVKPWHTNQLNPQYGE